MKLFRCFFIALHVTKVPESPVPREPSSQPPFTLTGAISLVCLSYDDVCVFSQPLWRSSLSLLAFAMIVSLQ